MSATSIARIMQLILVRLLGVSMFTSVRSAILLGSSAAAMLAAIGAASAEDSGAQMLVPPATMAQAARMTVLGAGAHRAISNLSSDQGEERMPMTLETAPHLIKEGQSKSSQDSPLRSELTFAAGAAKEIQRSLTLLAVVEADPSRTVQVLSPVAGRVVDLKVQRGDRVAQHQELAVVYNSLAETDDRRPRSAPVPPNKVTANGRQTSPQRNRSDAATECQRSEAEPARMARLCALVMPAEGMQSTQLLSLKAPVAGSVVDLKISPGAILDDPSASIMTIAVLDTIWVTTSLPKRNAPLLPMGSVEIVFIAYPDEVFTGEARFISNMPDPDPSGFKVRIELQNPSRRLKPNMFAFATFFWPKETVPIIPTTALILKNEMDRVLMEVEQ
jgi:cobalt-zinc-cadmium efflux system membrane fusion protein